MSRPVLPNTSAEVANPEGNGFDWRTLLIITFCALLYVCLDRLNGGPRLADVDDALRAIQIDQLWRDGNWYDLTLSAIRMPETYVSPWSRLVDLPYILIGRVLTCFSLDPQTALHWSFLIWPPVMLTAFCYLAFDIIRRLDLSGRRLRINTYVAFAVVLFMLPMIGEFTPGRIDHHNMQILMLGLIFAGVMRFTLIGGITSGIGASLLVSISLECLPVVAFVYSTLAVAWLFGMPGSRRMLSSVLLTTAVATPLLGLVLTGPMGISSVRCDEPSAPYIYIIAVSSLVVGLIVAITDVAAPSWKKAVFVLVPSAVICLGFVLWFPTCLSGPYAIIDPVSRHFWFDRIEQERSALILFQRGAQPQIIFLTVLVVVLLLALPGVIGRVRRGRTQEFVLYAGAFSTVAMTILLSRFVNYAAAVTPLLLPVVIDWIVPTLEGRANRKATQVLWASIIAPVGIAFLLFILIPRDIRPIDAIDYMNNDDCRRGDLTRLDALAPGLIVAPPGLAMTIAAENPAGLSVAGIPFHRASPGLRRTYLAFTSPDRGIRREALAPFDYLAVCRVGISLSGAEAPLYTALASGGLWPGLISLDRDEGAPLRLFRIDHDSLQ